MWNLRYISIRTEHDENIWFENHFQAEEKNQTIQEVQTWEFSSIQASSMIQFELQMFPVGKNKTTDWELVLEISSDVNKAWSHWLPLIGPCNQSDLYCEDLIGSTGSVFLASLHQAAKNITLPIPDTYANQDVRFRWTASQSNARFRIEKVYVGADCPWFCSGHGLCKSNGCQ